MVKHTFPPLYILAVFPSSSGSSISNGVVGYVIGISNVRSNSYRINSWTYQHFPLHLVPVLSEPIVNQSLLLALFDVTYPINAVYSSFNRLNHTSPSRGPALTVKRGIFLTVANVVPSQVSMANGNTHRPGGGTRGKLTRGPRPGGVP